MNLIELYDSLVIPEGDGNIFNSQVVSGFDNFRIAIDYEGNPVLLLSIAGAVKNNALKNFRLKYLRLVQNVECKVTENNIYRLERFTVITFVSSDKALQEYFLRVSETLIRAIGNSPTTDQILFTLNKFIEVFRSLNDVPLNTIYGLWSELFIIANSKNPEVLLNFWHEVPEEKFDFNTGQEKLEVKSNSNFERVHIFSSEQLNPTEGSQVIIASVFLRQSSKGQSIYGLLEEILSRVNFNSELELKLNGIICKTLGSSLEQSISIKFDSSIAKDSLRFYKHQDVGKIERIYIPENVYEVKYKSDLTNILPINIADYKSSRLFASL